MTWQSIVIIVILIILFAELALFYYFVKFNSQFLKSIQSISGIQFSSLDIDQKAPLFREIDEFGNKVIAKDVFSERNTLLLFINTNCPVCKSILPQLEKVISHYDINFIIINSDKITEDSHIKSVIKKQFTYIRSPQMTQSYLIQTVPYAIVINKEGRVEQSHTIKSINSIINLLVNQQAKAV